MEYQENKSIPKRSVAPPHETSSRAAGDRGMFLEDNRPIETIQQKPKDITENKNIDTPIQKKENNTGLPDDLKSGIENLSGFAMDDVKVHYNSDKPTQLNAHAYAQGTDIHLASGQEKHLAHEAWHVVQQKQGRVQPTKQLKSKVNINDDEGLEEEADVMGAKALQMKEIYSPEIKTTPPLNTTKSIIQSKDIVQLVTKKVGIRGLTHLVKMVGEHLYNGKDWLKNEGEEVKYGDILEVDTDDEFYSRRGIDQDTNWEEDGEEIPNHLWLKVTSLNGKLIEDDSYVRADMLMEPYEQIPKKAHSIWVQGDYQSNKEAQEGIKSRGDGNLEGWTSIMWLYDTGKKEGGFEKSELDEGIPIDDGPFKGVYQKGFIQEMEAWKERPEWVSAWLPILDILMEKKSYITMSDIMRMIILYYEGGLYMDVKIKATSEKASFKDTPKVYINRAHFYSLENWAIMANAGSKMIEDIMTQAYKQFPSIEKLSEYPENYQREGEGEGRMHVDLHEKLGVWNVIDRMRSSESEKYPLKTLKLVNPRPKNSWMNSYDDRDPEIIKAEEIGFVKSDIEKLERKKDKLGLELERTKEYQKLVERPDILKSMFNLSQKEIDELPKKIENSTLEIESIESEIRILKLDLFKKELELM